jgi:integrase
MSRRQDGTGSVYQRKDGRWVYAVTVDGKRVSRYAAAEEEARRLAAPATPPPPPAPEALTLAGWVRRWLDHVEPELRPSSHAMYAGLMELAVEAGGDKPLADLAPIDIAEMLSGLRKCHGPRRVQMVHLYLRTSLDVAVDWGLIDANPLARVGTPRWQRRQRDYWSLAETRSFLETALATTIRWGRLFAFLATTGLRVSEALALEWPDVDLDAGTVAISKALVWQPNQIKWDLVPPKTRAGHRRVSLPPTAVAALRLLPRKPGQRLFLTKNGTPPGHSTLRQSLRRLVIEAEVPYINVHGLRHVHAMLALEATKDPYAVQRRLGHSHVSVTLGVYGYSRRGDDATAAAIDGLLSPMA